MVRRAVMRLGWWSRATEIFSILKLCRLSNNINIQRVKDVLNFIENTSEVEPDNEKVIEINEDSINNSDDTVYDLTDEEI